jgi:hypothetical protein
MEKELRLNGVNASTGVKEIAIAKNEDVVSIVGKLEGGRSKPGAVQDDHQSLGNFSFTSAFMETYKQRRKNCSKIKRPT